MAIGQWAEPYLNGGNGAAGGGAGDLFVIRMKTINPPILDKSFSEIVSAKDAGKVVVLQISEKNIPLSWTGTVFEGFAVSYHEETSIGFQFVRIFDGGSDIAGISFETTEIGG